MTQQDTQPLTKQLELDLDYSKCTNKKLWDSGVVKFVINPLPIAANDQVTDADV